MVQLYSWFKFYFPLFKLIITHYHIPKDDRKIKFKPRINNLNHSRAKNSDGQKLPKTHFGISTHTFVAEGLFSSLPSSPSLLSVFMCSRISISPENLTGKDYTHTTSEDLHKNQDLHQDPSVFT